MKRALLLVLLVACGDNRSKAARDAAVDDAPDDASIDAPPDAPPDALTFTGFVIDLIQNKTSSTTDPVPASSFSTLPDPDLNNPDAYKTLFP